MKTRYLPLSLFAALAAATALAVDWRNLDEEHHLGGRKTSKGYLRGKVVLVDRWGVNCPPCRQMLPRVEEIWQSFKTKPFVVLGGHCAGWGDAAGVKALVKEHGLTYPIYEDAGLAALEPRFNAIPFLYVVDETGKVVYKGHDERAATQAIVTALTDMEAPRNADEWKRFLDFELEYLPGKAYMRLAEFKKKFPNEAKAYAEKERELHAIPDVKKLAELVDFARKAKDMRKFGEKQQGKQKRYEKLVKDALASPKYKPLLESANPFVVQEAKNALADLKWTAAGF